jgi:hypothetical protein
MNLVSIARQTSDCANSVALARPRHEWSMLRGFWLVCSLP